MSIRFPAAILCLVAALLPCGASFAAAAPELRPFTATYTITRGKTQYGSADVQLQRLGDGRWSYQLHTDIKGALAKRLLAMFSSTPAEQTQRGVFVMEGGRVVPQLFTADEGRSIAGNDQKLEFDWKRGRVTGIFDRKPVDLPTQPGLLDSQSMQVALMSELMAGRSPQRFVLVEKGRIRDYVYTPERPETVQTGIGEQRAVVYRSSRVGSDKTTLFWCAPDLRYVPLKVERRDGKDVELTLTMKTLVVDGESR